MYFRKLPGEKCFLSPIDPNDAELFTEWLNEMEVTVNLQLYNGIISREGERAALTELSKAHNYSIIDNETNTLLGNCGFFDIDQLNQTAEAGIFIGNKNFWNKGYGTEALSLLLDYGFKALNFHNVLLRTYEYNKRAMRAYEKVGFKKIGTRREGLYRNLERHNVIYMDIVPEDFFAPVKE
jgi:RimJ/RimL family protein N-acetyltransferase